MPKEHCKERSSVLAQQWQKKEIRDIPILILQKKGEHNK